MKKTWILLAVSILVVASCGKKEAKKATSSLKATGKQSEFKFDKDPVLMDGFTLNGMKINDTANNATVVLFPLQATSREVKISAQPTFKIIEQIMKSFAQNAKKEPRDGKTKNTLSVQVIYFSEYKNVLSCCYEAKQRFVSQSDTSVFIKSINYSKNSEKDVLFNQFFDVNANNAKDFLALWADKTIKEMPLSSLSSLDFNIEKDSISINLPNNKRVKQSIAKLSKYIVDVK
jgi:hypothetical protein